MATTPLRPLTPTAVFVLLLVFVPLHNSPVKPFPKAKTVVPWANAGKLNNTIVDETKIQTAFFNIDFRSSFPQVDTRGRLGRSGVLTAAIIQVQMPRARTTSCEYSFVRVSR